MGRCMGRCPSPGSQRLRPVPAGALADDFDLARLTPEFLGDPYPTYRALQAFAPCKQMANGQYILTRHADLSAIYHDVETYSSDKTFEFLPKYGHSPLYGHHTTSMVFNDPPLHGRVRRLISGALTLRAISGMEPKLRALVERLLDAMAPRTLSASSPLPSRPRSSITSSACRWMNASRCATGR